MKAALINTETNAVENIIIVDDLTWQPEGNFYLVGLSDDESCVVGQSYDNNANPRFFGTVTTKPKTYLTYEFLLRFTAEERAAARQAALTDPIIADFQQLSMVVPSIDTGNQDTINGMMYLVSTGIITQERYNQIMS
jgi:hypothetical protein